jgi:hypothetical protein
MECFRISTISRVPVRHSQAGQNAGPRVPEFRSTEPPLRNPCSKSNYAYAVSKKKRRGFVRAAPAATSKSMIISPSNLHKNAMTNPRAASAVGSRRRRSGAELPNDRPSTDTDCSAMSNIRVPRHGSMMDAPWEFPAAPPAEPASPQWSFHLPDWEPPRRLGAAAARTKRRGREKNKPSREAQMEEAAEGQRLRPTTVPMRNRPRGQSHHRPRIAQTTET